MNRISNGWRALGRTRQFALALLIALSVLQAVFLILAQFAWALPIVLVIAFLGGVQIKSSATVRDAARLARWELRLAKDANHVNRRRHRELVSGIRELSSNIRGLDAKLEAHHKQNKTVDLLREQVGRSVGQFTWLGEQVIETKAMTASVRQAVEEKIDSLGNVHKNQFSGLDTAIAAIAGQMLEALTLDGEKMRGEAAKLHESLVADVVSIDTRLQKAFDSGNSHSLERRLIAELSALAQLRDPIDAPDLPPIGGWAMSPLTMHLVRSLACTIGSDRTIVELGSGVSTAWTAHAISQKAAPPVYLAIDHHPDYARATRKYVDDLGLSSTVDVVLAPLEPVDIEGERFVWYGTDWIQNVTDIGLLIVDGPPAGKNTSARYPALPLLLDRLAEEATIVLDDVERPGESDTVTKWLQMPGVTVGELVGRSLVLKYSRPEQASK